MFMSASLERHIPTALIILYLAVASLYAVYTPPWQAPDEPAHFNYIRQLAIGRFPVMEDSDYNQAYQSEVISSQFADGYSIEPFTYEDYQPPLYYLLQTPIFLLSNGRLTALRLTGVILGALTLLLAIRALQSLFPHQPWLVATAAAFFAFLPQHIAMQASVNNDSLSELLIAAMLLAILHIWPRLGTDEDSPTQLIGLGILLGFAFLTKVTAYLMAPVIGVALLWKYWNDWQSLLRRAFIVFTPAAVLGSIWWVRNLVVYGWPDFLGIEAHDTAVVGQPTTIEWINTYGLAETIQQFFQTSFRSFWGQFGWMGVVMPAWIYQLLFLFTILIVVGLIFTVIASPGQQTATIIPVARLSLLSLLGLNILLYVTYNLTFVQHQGRYLFASLIPISAAVAVGMRGWLQFLNDERWPYLRLVVPAGIAFGLAGLALLALFRFIVPALT